MVVVKEFNLNELEDLELDDDEQKVLLSLFEKIANDEEEMMSKIIENIEQALKNVTKIAFTNGYFEVCMDEDKYDERDERVKENLAFLEEAQTAVLDMIIDLVNASDEGLTLKKFANLKHFEKEFDSLCNDYVQKGRYLAHSKYDEGTYKESYWLRKANETDEFIEPAIKSICKTIGELAS